MISGSEYIKTKYSGRSFWWWCVVFCPLIKTSIESEAFHLTRDYENSSIQNKQKYTSFKNLLYTIKNCFRDAHLEFYLRLLKTLSLILKGF